MDKIKKEMDNLKKRNYQVVFDDSERPLVKKQHIEGDKKNTIWIF